MIFLSPYLPPGVDWKLPLILGRRANMTNLSGSGAPFKLGGFGVSDVNVEPGRGKKNSYRPPMFSIVTRRFQACANMSFSSFFHSSTHSGIVKTPTIIVDPGRLSPSSS